MSRNTGKLRKEREREAGKDRDAAWGAGPAPIALMLSQGNNISDFCSQKIKANKQLQFKAIISVIQDRFGSLFN